MKTIARPRAIATKPRRRRYTCDDSMRGWGPGYSPPPKDADVIVQRLNGCLQYLEAQCTNAAIDEAHRQCLRDMIGAVNVAKVRCLALAACRHRR